MGLRPEFENVRSSIQHRVPPPDIERVVADVRSGGDSTCFPLLGWVLGVDFRLLRVLQINQVLAAEHASGHRPYGKNLQSGSFAGASGQRDMSKMLLLQEARSHDCRLSQAAECKLSSTVRHSSSCPETPTESETYQSPYSIGPLKHYFYDLRSTPTPDTDSFTPRQRKQIQRLNPSCHIFSSYRYLLPLTLTT